MCFHAVSAQICRPLAGCGTRQTDTASDRGSQAAWFPNTPGSTELRSSRRLQHSLLIVFKGTILRSFPAPLFSLPRWCASFPRALPAAALLSPPLPAELGREQAPCARNEIPLQGGSSLQVPRTSTEQPAAAAAAGGPASGGKLCLRSELPLQSINGDLGRTRYLQKHGC